MKAEEYLNRQEGYNVDRILDDKDLTLCVIELLSEYSKLQNQQLLLDYIKYQNSEGYKPETLIDDEVDKFLSNYKKS